MLELEFHENDDDVIHDFFSFFSEKKFCSKDQQNEKKNSFVVPKLWHKRQRPLSHFPVDSLIKRSILNKFI